MATTSANWIDEARHLIRCDHKLLVYPEGKAGYVIAHHDGTTFALPDSVHAFVFDGLDEIRGFLVDHDFDENDVYIMLFLRRA